MDKKALEFVTYCISKLAQVYNIFCIFAAYSLSFKLESARGI